MVPGGGAERSRLRGPSPPDYASPSLLAVNIRSFRPPQAPARRARSHRVIRMAPFAPACACAPTVLLAAMAGLLTAAPAAAQSLADGIMAPRRTLRASVDYGNERWDHYWEGTRERTNANLGTVATQTATVTAMYGVTDRLSVGASLPYVWTRASEGVLRGQRGAQDVTVAAKLRVLQARVAGRATFGALLIGGAGAPTSDYTPDFQPMSIGLGARRATLRGALHLQDRTGWFLDGSAGRAWRSTVHLDRPAYYTDGRLTLSDEVAMPDVADYAAGLGFQDARWCVPVMLVGQRTLGGGDIRRQDMPFVSNRMNFTRLQARAMYTLPFAPGLALDAGAARTLGGRNVGRATAVSAGATLAFRL